MKRDIHVKSDAVGVALCGVNKEPLLGQDGARHPGIREGLCEKCLTILEPPVPLEASTYEDPDDMAIALREAREELESHANQEVAWKLQIDTIKAELADAKALAEGALDVQAECEREMFGLRAKVTALKAALTNDRAAFDDIEDTECSSGDHFSLRDRAKSRECPQVGARRRITTLDAILGTETP